MARLAGFALSGQGGECVAALSIVVPAADPGRQSWAPAVRAAAFGISRQLRRPSSGEHRSAGR